MKSKHTHQGTCQACGAVQAVDNVTRLIAKHGYKVAGFGFFNGTCQGSDHPPAEVEVFLTYKIIESCLAWAANMDRMADLYRTRTIMITTWDKQVYVRGDNFSDNRSKYVTKTYPMFGCSDAQVDRQYMLEVEGHESQARNARSHVAALKGAVLPRLGCGLYPVSHKAAARQFAVGEVVKLHGKDFVLVAPRYGMSSQSTPKFWKGHYKDDADKKMYFPTIRTLRSQN